MNSGSTYNNALTYKGDKQPGFYKASVELVVRDTHETIKNTISCKIRLQASGFQGNNPVIRMERSHFVVNNKNPETLIDQITLKTAQTIDTLELLLNENGKIKSVLNVEQVQNQWALIRQNIIDEYPGESVASFLDIIGKSLETPEELFNSLQRDPLLFNLFHGYYHSYGITQKIKDTYRTGSLLPGICLHFATIKTRKDLSDGIVEIQESGELITENIEKEQFMNAFNTRTRANSRGYSRLYGRAELTTSISDNGHILKHSSTCRIEADDIHVENTVKLHT
jgi:hypothetical protein